MALNLMLHCGADHVAREQVDAVKTPDPTDTWFPIPHDALIDNVQRELEVNNLRIVQAAHGLTREGDRYFGMMEVANDRNDGGEYNLVVGLRNSHDQSFSAGLAVGAGVFVCDNLSFSGEVTIARRHTRHIMRDLSSMISRSMGALNDMRRSQEERIAAYKTTECDDVRFHDLAVRAVDQRVLPPSRLPKLLEAWRTPPHPEFEERNAWSAFNAFTEVFKVRPNVHALPARSNKLHGLVDTFCGLAV